MTSADDQVEEGARTDDAAAEEDVEAAVVAATQVGEAESASHDAHDELNGGDMVSKMAQ